MRFPRVLVFVQCTCLVSVAFAEGLHFSAFHFLLQLESVQMVHSGWRELTKEATPPIMLLVCVEGDDGVSGDGVSGDGVSGDGVSGDGVSGDGVSGDCVSGDGVSGDGVSGDGVSGGSVRCEGVRGDGVSGEGVSGEGVRDEVVQWCVGKGVELVEWSPHKTAQEEEEKKEEEEDGMFTATLLHNSTIVICDRI